MRVLLISGAHVHHNASARAFPWLRVALRKRLFFRRELIDQRSSEEWVQTLARNAPVSAGISAAVSAAAIGAIAVYDTERDGAVAHAE